MSDCSKQATQIKAAVYGRPPPEWRCVTNCWASVQIDLADICLVFVDQPDAMSAFHSAKSDVLSCPVIGGYQNAFGDVFLAGCDFGVCLSSSAAELSAQIVAIMKRVKAARSERLKAQKIKENLADLREKFAALDTDLIAAKHLQQGLIQDRQHKFDSGCLSLLLQERSHIGGDMVGHFPVDNDIVGFFAFDVSGHGISSALLIARLAGMVLGASPATNIALTQRDGRTICRSPAKVLEDLNDIMFEELETDHFFTAVLGFFNHVTGQITLCQGGHPHPLYIARSGHIWSIGEGGLPIGLIPGAEFRDTTVRLLPGDRLLVISDGIPETPNRDRTNQLSERGLAWLLTQYHEMDALNLFVRLLSDLKQFQGSADFEDDLSAVMLDFHPMAMNLDTANLSPSTAKSRVAVV